MSQVVCPECQIEMRLEKAGVAAEAMSTMGSYQLFFADLYACPGCKKEVITRFAQTPISEHFRHGYLDAVQALASQGHYPYWANQQEKLKYESK